MKTKMLLIVILLALAAQAGFGQTANEWSSRGVQYYNQGDYPNAIECFLKAKDIHERTIGKEHPDYATSLNNLGALYRNMGDYAKAERYLLEGIAIDEKALGKEHPDYAGSLNNLGALYYNMGDYAKAERY